MKKFVPGLLAGIILASASAAYAEEGLQKVEAYLRPALPITLDGKPAKLESSPVIYDGSTYLKLRDLAALTGLQVNWNEAAQTVELQNGEAKISSHVIESKASTITDFLQTKSLELISGDIGDDKVTLTIRKLHDHRSLLKASEVSELISSIYRLIGQNNFDLIIDQFIIPETANIVGEISSIDVENKKVLIINKDKINSNGNPDAVWVSFTPDAFIGIDSKERIPFNDLKVGQKVKAWSVGAGFDSYPGRARVIQLIVAKE
ncbi:stalk domain-containing protein [Paenibacillus hamazuiensis]|uniref:stalk domain-containing protein n=1 Tax=Paenibacillus hamazuiensis TaxID=2936508 RepID=UPI00200CDA3F|nr:stalk domain-containing protein [Paenibacillus hamazuiensis]